DRRRVVVVAKLLEPAVRVRAMNEHVQPRRHARHVDVLSVEERGIAVGEADGLALLDAARGPIAGAARAEEAGTGEVLHALRGEAVVVGEAEPGLAVATDERVVRSTSQLVALERL